MISVNFSPHCHHTKRKSVVKIFLDFELNDFFFDHLQGRVPRVDMETLNFTLNLYISGSEQLSPLTLGLMGHMHNQEC